MQNRCWNDSLATLPSLPRKETGLEDVDLSLKNLFSRQTGCGRGGLEFMAQINGADAGMVRRDPGFFSPTLKSGWETSKQRASIFFRAKKHGYRRPKAT